MFIFTYIYKNIQIFPIIKIGLLTQLLPQNNIQITIFQILPIYEVNRTLPIIYYKYVL